VTSLTTKTARAKLTPRREPYWFQIGRGAYLGFRRGSDTWVARFRDRDGRQHYHALGRCDEFAKTKAAAEEWFESMSAGARRAPKHGTVREALESYIEDLRRQGREASAAESEARFKLTTYGDQLADLTLESATRDDFEGWRDRLRDGRQPRSVNRQVRALVAALNRATAELGHVGNPAAWSLRALSDDTEEGAEAAIFVSAEQRAWLIAKCPKPLAVFLRGLELTGARPSELALAVVADFDPKAQALTLRHRQGGPARLRARLLALSPAGAAFFRAQVRGKRPGAPLCANEAGGHWRRHEWSIGIRAAIVEANKLAKRGQLILLGTSAYSFRHAHIRELLQVLNVDPLSVAAQSGTSLAMMQKYYFKFVSSALREKLDATAALQP
jgi:integrase